MRRIKTILAVISNEQLSEEILKKSLELAKQFEAKLILLHTIHIPFLHLPSYNRDVPLDKEQIKKSIDAKVTTLMGDDAVEYHTFVYFGDRTERAILEAKRDEVDLIVGSSALAIDKMMVSVQKPILIINRETRPYENILIPTDLSDTSKATIQRTKAYFPQSKIALVYGYESLVMINSIYDMSYVDVVDFQDGNRGVSLARLEKIKETEGLEGELIDSTGSLAWSLVEYIEQNAPDLVMVASGNRENFAFGSVSSYIAREAHCDVFIDV